jgi:hypothetical protein
LQAKQYTDYEKFIPLFLDVRFSQKHFIWILFKILILHFEIA